MALIVYTCRNALVNAIIRQIIPAPTATGYADIYTFSAKATINITGATRWMLPARADTPQRINNHQQRIVWSNNGHTDGEDFMLRIRYDTAVNNTVRVLTHNGHPNTHTEPTHVCASAPNARSEIHAESTPAT